MKKGTKIRKKYDTKAKNKYSYIEYLFRNQNSDIYAFYTYIPRIQASNFSFFLVERAGKDFGREVDDYTAIIGLLVQNARAAAGAHRRGSAFFR